MTRLLLAVFLLALASAGLSGCGTIAGAGQDIQRGGKAITNTAKDVDRDM